MDGCSYTKHEMEWSIRYFRHMATKWRNWASLREVQNKAGHTSYALRQAEMWEGLANDGEATYKKHNPQYILIFSL